MLCAVPLYVIVWFFIKPDFVTASLNDLVYDRIPALFGLDQYDKCLRQEGTYCLLRLDLHAEPENDLMKIIREHSLHDTKHYNYTYIQRGVCITKTCDKYVDKNNITDKDLNNEIETCMNAKISEEYGLEAKLVHVFYRDSYNSPTHTDIVDWIVGAILFGLIIVNIVGSCYDIMFRNIVYETNNRTANPFLMSFSIMKNTENLIKPKQHDVRTERLQGLHGIRSITSFWVISAHVLIIYAAGFTDNPQDYEKGFENGTYQLIINGFTIVQIFFVISGFLLAYNFQVHSETGTLTWKDIPKIMLNRWLRLTPAYALMIAFTATWLRHVGSGPLWNLFVTGGAVADCRKYWWLHLLYLQNYVPDDKFCALQTWHLAADTQVFLVGVVVYVSTQTRGRRAALATMLMLGMAAPALHVWLQDLDAIVLIGPEVSRTFSIDTYYKMHICGHNNLPGFAIGMATGLLVYDWQKNKVDISQYKLFRYLCWAVIPSIFLLFLSGSIFYPTEGRASLGLRIVYAASHRAVMSVIVAFCLITLFMRCEDKFRGIFEWPGWSIPGKLSYSVFLLHMIFVQVIMGTTTQLRHVSLFDMIIVHLGVVTFTYLVALPYHLLVEAPIYRFVKAFSERKYQKTPKKTD